MKKKIKILFVILIIISASIVVYVIDFKIKRIGYCASRANESECIKQYDQNYHIWSSKINKNSEVVDNTDISKFNIPLFESEKPNYKLRVIQIYQEHGEPSEVSVYSDKSDGSIKILEASYGGETFRHSYAYYFNNSNDFFVIEKAEKWDRPYPEEGRIRIVNETDNYLFTDLTMTEWLDSTNSIVSSNSEKFKQKQGELLQQLDVMMTAISSENN